MERQNLTIRTSVKRFAPDQRAFQESQEPHRRGQPPRHPLQLVPAPRDDPLHSCVIDVSKPKSVAEGVR